MVVPDLKIKSMELQISRTREELLRNTINYFNTSNRGVHVDGNGETCTLINLETDSRCAIGREIPEDLAIEIDSCGAVSDIYDDLPVRLKGMGCDFLEEIQTLHDVEANWNENGLSDFGYKRTKNIISKYNLDLEL